MTKTPPTPPAPSPVPTPASGGVTPTQVATAVDTGFQFEDAASFAKPVKAAGVAGKGVVTETTKKLTVIPANKTFLVPVAVPDTLTDVNARNEHFKAEAKKELSRVSGAVRRLRNSKADTSHASKNFTVAIVSSEELGYGVRVWRDEDTAAA